MNDTLVLSAEVFGCILMGLLYLKLIPDTPAAAKFLNDEERTWLIDELSQGAETSPSNRGRPVAARTFTSKHRYSWYVSIASIQTPSPACGWSAAGSM